MYQPYHDAQNAKDTLNGFISTRQAMTRRATFFHMFVIAPWAAFYALRYRYLLSLLVTYS